MWTDCLPDTVVEDFKLKASWSLLRRHRKRWSPDSDIRAVLPEAEITANIDSEKVWVIIYE